MLLNLMNLFQYTYKNQLILFDGIIKIESSLILLVEASRVILFEFTSM